MVKQINEVARIKHKENKNYNNRASRNLEVLVKDDTWSVREDLDWGGDNNN